MTRALMLAAALMAGAAQAQTVNCSTSFQGYRVCQDFARLPLDRVGPRRNAVRPGQPGQPMDDQPLAGDRNHHRRAARALTLTQDARSASPTAAWVAFVAFPAGWTPAMPKRPSCPRRRARGFQQTESRPVFYSLPRRRRYARHGVDRPASRYAGPRSLLPRPPQRSMEARPCSSQ